MVVGTSRSIGRSRRGQLGVTLVELMIAVAIVGILAAIAYPSYQASVRRGNRTDGKAELMQAAQELEKCFTRFGAYNDAGCASFAETNTGNRLSEQGKYRITFVAGSVTPMTFTLQAALEPGRGLDPECGTLTLDQTGLRGRSGTDPVARCW
ncbi:MAG: type IV pilin protein [Pseudomonadota bacterium]|nr:type IV pilin protein [Pseudomonadota bacterium]